jgi:hypothetical protein
MADLKMENVGISGFDNEKINSNTNDIIVRLADLGASMCHVRASRSMAQHI